MKFWKNVTPKQWLEWLLPLYVLLLPWQARWIITPFSSDAPRYGDLSMYATDALFFALVACWFFYLRAERQKPHGDWRRLRPVIIPVLAVMTYIVISLLWTPEQIVGREQMFRLSQGVLVAMMLASGAVSRERLFLALALGGAVQGVFAVAQFFMQMVPASTLLGMAAQAPEQLGVSVVEYGDQRWLRAYGTLPHPNMLGAFCAAAFLASASLYWRGYELLLRERPVSLARAYTSIGWVCAIFSYFGVLFSFSRNAWLALGAAAVAMIAMVCASKRDAVQYAAIAAGKLAGLCVLLLLFFSAIFGPLWWQRASDETRLAQQSVNERAMLREQANQLSSQAPFFGHGAGAYLPVLVKTYPEQPAYAYQPVHSAWRMLRVELGWAGLFLAIAAVAALAWVFVRERSYAGAAFTTMWLVSSQFDHFWYSLPFGILLAATLLSLPLAKSEESW